MTYESGITIDGTYYDIPMISLTRNVEFLDKYAERTLDGVLHRELIGVYYNFTLSIGTISDMNTYNALFYKLAEATEFHEVILPTSDGNYSFTAYVTGLTDNAYKMIDGVNYFNGLTCTFIAQSPARS